MDNDNVKPASPPILFKLKVGFFDRDICFVEILGCFRGQRVKAATHGSKALPIGVFGEVPYTMMPARVDALTISARVVLQDIASRCVADTVLPKLIE